MIKSNAVAWQPNLHFDRTSVHAGRSKSGGRILGSLSCKRLLDRAIQCERGEDPNFGRTRERSPRTESEREILQCRF